MTLICLRCIAKGTVALLLDETPRFTCNKCGQTYGSAEARAELAQLRECCEKLLTWAESVPGLLTFGRHGLFAHNNSHHALDMGWAAAGALGSDGSFDEAAWASSLVGFASHVVED